MLTEHSVYNVATLEERNWLARELHDNLAQNLGYLKIKASLVGESLDIFDIDRAQAQLQELKAVVSELYVDVREEIFSLRSQVSTQDEFLPRLREYLAAFQRQYKVETHLVVADDELLLNLPARSGNQLMRIVQEALTNVRKHARAGQVTVRIEARQGQMCLTIEDNGRGFNPLQSRRQGQSFGLKIMEERAESVGGCLTLNTAPGLGTRLSIKFNTPAPLKVLQPEPELQM